MSAYMSVNHLHVWYARKLKKGIKFPGAGVTDSCDLPHRYLELNSGPVKEYYLCKPLSPYFVF